MNIIDQLGAARSATTDWEMSRIAFENSGVVECDRNFAVIRVRDEYRKYIKLRILFIHEETGGSHLNACGQ